MNPTNATAPGWTTEGESNDQDGTGSVLPIVAPAAPEIPDNTAVRCRVCGHVLTADRSVHRQLGPVCAHRIAAAVRVPGWRVDDVVVGDHGTAIAIVLMPEAVVA